MRQDSPELDALRQDPQAAALLKDPAALRQLLSAPETRKLMQLLQQNGGASLKQAAQAAARGRPEALQQLVDQVSASREGAQALSQLQEKTKQS